MRFRLRTLMIVLALGPPAVAGWWLIAKPLTLFWPALILFTVVYITILIAIGCTIRAASTT